jgi:hypothetical protein
LIIVENFQMILVALWFQFVFLVVWGARFFFTWSFSHILLNVGWHCIIYNKRFSYPYQCSLQQLVEVRYNFANNCLTVVLPADNDLRRCHMHLYASVPEFILQNNRAVKIMHFSLPVNNLSYRIEFWLFVNQVVKN